MRASTYEYPFEFQFPNKFGLNGGNEFNDEGFAPERSRQGLQPLPPSCFDGGNERCAIYYHLTARVPKTLVDWEDKCTLLFSPFRTEPNPSPLFKTAKDLGAPKERQYVSRMKEPVDHCRREK
jgi:hypothetical protein